VVFTNTTVSWSFGYTAGAAYRNADASLVFGGYDSFRLGESAHSFPFSGDLDQPLTARLATIVIIDGLHSDIPVSILHSTTPVLLDSTSPYFELPEATCKEFERTFDLEFDPESGQFQTNRSTKRRLRERNPKVRFKLAEADDGVEVELPYASFDLQIGSALDDEDEMTYFPIKTTTNNQPSVLGRAFFQEAYLIVDYERNNFTLGQCVFPPAGALLPNATIINWNRELNIIAWSWFNFFVFGMILLGLLGGIFILSQLPSLLMRWLLETARARKLERREQQLERLWKEIHSSKPLQELSADSSRIKGDSSPPNTTFIPEIDDATSDEEDLSSTQAIAKARAGKKRATPLQILM
jgi:hypothetical protein